MSLFVVSVCYIELILKLKNMMHLYDKKRLIYPNLTGLQHLLRNKLYI